MKVFSKNGWNRRKSDREGYSEFFEKHIDIIRKGRLKCAECGDILTADVSEVAHILEKSYFKSVALNDENVLYLCSWKSKNNCHSRFDGTSEQLQSMTIFKSAQAIAKILLETEVTENFNYKKLDKWLL